MSKDPEYLSSAYILLAELNNNIQESESLAVVKTFHNPEILKNTNEALVVLVLLR